MIDEPRRIKKANWPLMSAQPEKVHITKELKCGKPLVSCRFDPTGRYVFAGCEDDTIER